MSGSADKRTSRARLHRVLDDDFASPPAGLVRGLLVGLIVVNLAASVMESVPALHQRYETYFELIEFVSRNPCLQKLADQSEPVCAIQLLSRPFSLDHLD